MWWEWHFASVVFVPQISYPRLLSWKYQTNQELRDNLQNTWPALLQAEQLSQTEEIKET